jgi:Tfp pilus assembly protein PilF/ketosteroid isomerase-like protein
MAMRRIAVLLLVLAALLPGLSQAVDEFQTAQQLYRKGQRDEALARLDEYLAKQPRDARARFLRGVILSEEGKRAEAIAVFTSLTQDFPELPEPYNNLAVLYAGQANYDRAREALLMAIRTHPGYATAHENLGDVYAAMAREAYKQTIELDKKNQSAAQKLSVLRELLPHKKEAETARAAPAATQGEAVVQAAPALTEPRAEALPPVPVTVPPAQAPAPPGEASLDASPESPALSAAPQLAAGEPAAPMQEAGAPPVPVMQRIETVLRTVDEWAKAWSRRDPDAYLSCYAPSFRPPKGESRAKWEASRRSEFARLRNVSVKVIEPQVTFRDAQHASVTFGQEYASATQKVSGRKTLELVRQDERWLITQETFVRR